MRLGSLVLGLLILVGGYASSAAQPAELQPVAPALGKVLRAAHDAQAPRPEVVTRTIIDELTRNLAWVPGVLVFLAALLRRDRGAWWFAFLAGVATVVIFGASAFLARFGDWLQTTVGMLVGTVVVLVVTFGLFVLHQKRLDIFARTEITFGVIGVGYSLSAIQQPGVWAALIVSIYGLVEGFTRMREADGPASLLAAFDGAAATSGR